MIEFISLKLAYFRSFVEEQTFIFPKGPGFYQISGVNQVNPEIGSNGSGKTSLWDGLSWVLYGKTARGLKASDIANWFEPGLTSGAVAFKKGDRYYTLSRTWNPNSLTIEKSAVPARRLGIRDVIEYGQRAPKTVTQDEVDKLLGLDPDAFLSSVLMGQFNDFFFDLGSAEKLQVFSRMLGLQRWVNLSKQAKERSYKAEARVRHLEKQVSEMDGQIRVLRQQCEIEHKNEKEYDEQHRVRVRQLKDNVVQAEQAVKVARKTKVADFKAITDRKDALERILLQDDANRKKVDQEVRSLELQIARLGEVEFNDRCPTCHQQLPFETLKRMRSEHEGKSHQKNLLTSRLKKSTARLSDLDKNISVQMLKLKALDTEWNAAQRDATSKGNAATKAEMALREARAALEAENRSVPPFRARIEELQRQLSAVKAERRSCQRRVDHFQSLREGYEFWQREFRDVRLWLVEEALRQLEVEVANSLIQLGLRGWKVLFDVERTTKSGSVSKGFNVLIHPPNLDRPVRWESWCGGETQRLRVAGALGLASLIRTRTGVTCNVEVWDEPTTWLSEEGIADLLQFFEGRSRDEKRQVWIIDHRSLSAGNFDGSVQIVKTREGSLIRSRSVKYGVER